MSKLSLSVEKAAKARQSALARTGPMDAVSPLALWEPTRLTLPETLTFEEWQGIGAVLGQIESAHQWWMGDWWRFGERRYGERSAQAIDSAWSFQTWADAGWVAGRVETSRRREVLSWSHHKEVAALEPEKQDQWLDLAERNKLSRNDLRSAIHGSGHLAALMTSDTPEWYTPAHVVACVVEALGAIDLDPCSNPGEPNVPATTHYTEADNGLDYGWQGRVYMNPPYGDVIGTWTDKLANEYEQGNVTEAIALVPARTDTAWFRRLPATEACFVSGRLRFSGAETGAPFPSVALYLGQRVGAFRDAFRGLGDLWERQP